MCLICPVSLCWVLLGWLSWRHTNLKLSNFFSSLRMICECQSKRERKKKIMIVLLVFSQLIRFNHIPCISKCVLFKFAAVCNWLNCASFFTRMSIANKCAYRGKFTIKQYQDHIVIEWRIIKDFIRVSSTLMQSVGQWWWTH